MGDVNGLIDVPGRSTAKFRKGENCSIGVLISGCYSNVSFSRTLRSILLIRSM